MSGDRGDGSHGGGHRHETIPPEGWMDRPESVKNFFRVFYAVCALLLLAELLLLGAENAHPHPLEERMRFLVYPVYGFLSFWFLVLLARPMRSLLIRSEEYYEGGGPYREDEVGGHGHGRLGPGAPGHDASAHDASGGQPPGDGAPREDGR